MNLLKLISGLYAVEQTTFGVGSAVAVVAGVAGAAGAVGGAIGLTGIMADVVGGALIGGAISGVTGGNVLTGALTGGIGGGLSGYLSGAAGVGTGIGSTTGSAVLGNAAVDSFGMQVTPGILTGAAGTGLTTAAASSFVPGLLTNTAGLGVDALGNSLAGAMSPGILGPGGYGSISSMINNPLVSLSNPLQTLGAGTAQKAGGSNLSTLIGAGMNIFGAMNAQTPQNPNAAQQGANPWAPYAKQAAAQLNALNNNPNLVYGLPGYAWQQQQGQQAVDRSAAAAGANLSGGTLSALNQQAQSTASDFFNNRVNQLSQMAGATPQNMIAGQQAYNVAQYNQSLAQANQANMLSAGLAQLGQFFFA
jgi:hypothetical protein